MRRKDREITDINKIIEIIEKCDSCNIALNNGEYPYIVPMNFGYKYENGKLSLYFHSANAGTKIELLKKDNHAAFSMHTAHKLILDDIACGSTMKYESVCGNGEIRLLNDDEKLGALTRLMDKYQTGKEHMFDEKAVLAVAVMELKVKNISGKSNY